ncbi:MAG: TonB-dependent receptor plug domain-containing protein [Tepidisphaerales bacterium]
MNRHYQQLAWVGGFRTTACLLLAVAGYAMPAAADEAASQKSASDLTQLSIEELMKVNVLDKQITSVSGMKQRIADAPAAVTIITNDDIHRSGLASIPEILRLAPGMQVAQINGSEWAISCRGFDQIYANKLLVLQDGRTLYNRGFSGVFWGMQDTVLDDIDRIEVIRGPGATIWGSNAVNGVINITTKDAKDTQGLLMDTRVGTDLQTESVRYGGRLAENTYYRVYGKYRLSDDLVYAEQTRGGATPAEPGSDAHDGWHDAMLGFRVDRHADVQSHLTVNGEVSAGQADNSGTLSRFTPPLEKLVDYTTDTNAAHLLARWTHADGDGSEYSLQGYVDHVQRLDDFTVGYTQDTLDLEFRHRFELARRHEFIWGIDGRVIFDRIRATEQLRLDPDQDTSLMLSAFVQDCWSIVPERLRLYLGTKLEVNNYSGFEYQPSARMLWTPDDRQSAWAGISRAVRTPSRGEQDGTLRVASEPTPLGVPAVATFTGNPDTESEELLAYEIGYRIKPAESLSIDLAGFVNVYRHLVTSSYAQPTMVMSPPHLAVELTRGNDMSGETFGTEAAVDWRVCDAWRLSGSYTWLANDLRESGTTNTDELEQQENFPHNQFQLHSYWDIARNVSLNASAYYVDALKAHDIPPYVRLDVNLSWRPTRNVELIVGGSNLLDSSHPEWIETGSKSLTTEPKQAFYGQMILRF